MKLISPVLVIIVFLSHLSLSCVYGQSPADKKTEKDIKQILSSFRSYYQYENRYINLSKEYTAINESGSPLSRGKFLQALSGGRYLPVLIPTKTGKPQYKLYQLPQKTDKDIKSRLRQLGEQYYKYYKMEGSKLPDFNFVDLNGNSYTNRSTNNKTLILKCWFIHCVVCVQEMPELNKLVDKYKTRKDVLFLGLALDAKKDLKAFLSKTKFSYMVVPNMEKYINHLQISQFPTHLIVKNGRIFKVLDNADDLAAALNNPI